MVVAGKRLLRCAITDLGSDPDADLDTQGLDPAAARRTQLRAWVRQWAVDEVDIVQLREKRLESGELLLLSRAAMEDLREVAAVRGGAPRTRLVVNGRADVAAAAGADGVHLTAREGEVRPEQVRKIFTAAGLPECFVSVSCHAVEEVTAARKAGADLILFGPVFEKRVGKMLTRTGTGLDRLHMACAAAGTVPVLALGGVTDARVQGCAEAGAAGVAGIRLFASGALDG